MFHLPIGQQSSVTTSVTRYIAMSRWTPSALSMAWICHLTRHFCSLNPHVCQWNSNFARQLPHFAAENSDFFLVISPNFGQTPNFVGDVPRIFPGSVCLKSPFLWPPWPPTPPPVVAFIQASPRRCLGSSRPRAQRELVNSSSAANGCMPGPEVSAKKEGPSSKNGAKIEFTRRHDRLKQKNVGSSKKNLRAGGGGRKVV